jgi:hypothetical protein
MKNLKKHTFEYALVFLTIFLSITGFWNIYFGVNANPTRYQNLHIVTISIWLGLWLRSHHHGTLAYPKIDEI